MAHRAPDRWNSKETFFNFRVDAMEPLLGALGSLPIGGDSSSNFAFRASASRSWSENFLRNTERVLLFSSATPAAFLVDQLQYRCLPCQVDRYDRGLQFSTKT